MGSLGLVRYVCYVYVCNAVWDHWVRRGQGVHSFYCMGSLPSACRIVPYRIVPSGPACIRLHGIRSGPGLVVVYHLHWLYALGGTGVSGVMVVYGLQWFHAWWYHLEYARWVCMGVRWGGVGEWVPSGPASRPHLMWYLLWYRGLVPSYSRAVDGVTRGCSGLTMAWCWCKRSDRVGTVGCAVVHVPHGSDSFMAFMQ